MRVLGLSFGGVHPETKVLLEIDVLGTKTQEKTVMCSPKISNHPWIIEWMVKKYQVFFGDG